MRGRDECVHLGNLPAFMVSSEDGESVSVSDLESNEERHSLDRVIPSIHIVAHEQVVGVGRGAT